MDKVIAVVGFFTCYAIAWQRIFRHQQRRGRRAVIAHLCGFFLGSVPALFFVLTVALVAESSEKEPLTIGILFFGLCFAYSAFGIYQETRPSQVDKTLPTSRLINTLRPYLEQAWCARRDRMRRWKKQKTQCAGEDNVQAVPVPAPVAQPSRRASRRAASKSVAKPQPLDKIQFRYRDESGKESTRQVTVEAVDREYLEGICHLRHAKRTFRLQRIRGDITSLITGEISKPSRWSKDLRRNTGVPAIVVSRPSQQTNARRSEKPRGWQTAVLFAGFRTNKRDALATLAEAADWQVRTGFSRTLDLMVAGSSTGSAQLAQAEAHGVEVISEQEFYQRVNTYPAIGFKSQQ